MYAYSLLTLPSNPARPIGVKTSATRYGDLDQAIKAVDQDHDGVSWPPAFHPLPGHAVGRLPATRTGQRIVVIHSDIDTEVDIVRTAEDAMRRSAVASSALLTYVADQLPQEAI